MFEKIGTWLWSLFREFFAWLEWDYRTADDEELMIEEFNRQLDARRNRHG